MRQAQVTAWGEKPELLEVPEPPPPAAHEIRVKVEATGIHRVVRSGAAGKNYSAKTLPHIPGIDGVGTTDDGQRGYFFSFSTGALSEYINIPTSAFYPLPDAADTHQIAGAINPAISSWMALNGRTSHLPPNFAVLILGATSASGRLAIPLARALGAKKVIGAARDPSTLAQLGLDQTVVIAREAERTDFSHLDDVDVVLDYVYGPLAIHFFRSLQTPKAVQYVHVGALSRTEITLPGDVLRSKDITVRGSGPGSWTLQAFSRTLPDLLAAMLRLPALPVRVVKLEDIEQEWDYSGPERLVVVP